MRKRKRETERVGRDIEREREPIYSFPSNMKLSLPSLPTALRSSGSDVFLSKQGSIFLLLQQKQMGSSPSCFVSVPCRFVLTCFLERITLNSIHVLNYLQNLCLFLN